MNKKNEHPFIKRINTVKLDKKNNWPSIDLRTFESDFFHESIKTVKSSNIENQLLDDNFLASLAVHGNLKIDPEHLSLVSNYFGIQEKNIISTSGASSALDIVITAFSLPSAKILIPLPFFPSYKQLIKLRRSTPLYYDAINNEKAIDDIKKGLTEGASAIIINQPNNPTGLLLNKQVISEIKYTADKYGAYIIWDNTYSWMIDNTYETNNENDILIYSFGKWSGLTGLRSGVIISSNDKLRSIIEEVKVLSFFSESKIDRMIVNLFLRQGHEFMETLHTSIISELELRRKQLFDILRNFKINCDSIEFGKGYTFTTINQLFINKNLNINGIAGEYFGLLGGESRYCLAVSSSRWALFTKMLKQI